MGKSTIYYHLKQHYNIFPASIGSYERGDFEHNISFDEIIPLLSHQDKATTLAQLNGVAELTLEAKLKLAGYSADELQTVIPENNAEK